MELKDKFKKCLQKLRKKKSVDMDFQFLSENPISGNYSNPLSFGHDQIVSTLKDIVSNCPESFTIGLYGDWGSGKSTIAFTLKEELEEINIPLVLFDVWKHEGDALRRTFLRQTHYYFKQNSKWKDKYKGKDEMLDELSKTRKEVKRSSLSIWQILRGSIMLPISFLILALLTWLIFDVLLGLDLFKKDNIPESIAVFLGLFPISFLFKFTVKLIENIKGDKEEYFQEKIQDPIEFENKFKQILNDLHSEIKKIVFVFDNLDRVSGEKAIQIMATIKTFLDPIDKSLKNRNIVFLIPCDETAIKRHLRRTLSYSKDFRGDEYHSYAGEYLRKFFNTIVWIPEFYINELEDLANTKLRETKIKDFNNDELAALIVLVFNKNPRQIIQFINILISNYIVVKKRGINGFSLSKDIAKLAKYLLLLQKFPDIMEVYRRNMINKLEETPAELAETSNGGERKFSENRVSEFAEFLKLTEHVRIESLDLFFKLRESKFENELEDSERILKLIETNKIIDLINYENQEEKETADKNIVAEYEFFRSLNLVGKEHEFSQVVNEKFRKMNNPILVAKFVEGLLNFTKYKGLILEHRTYRNIYDKLNRENSHISVINPNNLITEFHDKMTSSSDKIRLRRIIGTRQAKDFAKSFGM